MSNELIKNNLLFGTSDECHVLDAYELFGFSSLCKYSGINLFFTNRIARNGLQDFKNRVATMSIYIILCKQLK